MGNKAGENLLYYCRDISILKDFKSKKRKIIPRKGLSEFTRETDKRMKMMANLNNRFGYHRDEIM